MIYQNRNVSRTIEHESKTTRQIHISKALQKYEKKNVLTPRKQSQNIEYTTIQRDKNKHTAGDLYYGINSVRYNALDTLNIFNVKTGTVNDPASVDSLNKLSNITSVFSSNRDYMSGYFNVKNKIPNLGAAGIQDTIILDWLLFVKNNWSYIDIDKKINMFKLNNNSGDNNIKKNGINDSSKMVGEWQKDIVSAYDNKTIQGLTAESRNNVNAWMWYVFFRKISKLGIKFAVENKKVIHFNMNAPYEGVTYPHHTLAYKDAANTSLEKQPITHSEIRYINRNYGFNHPYIHMFYYGSAVAGLIDDERMNEFATMADKGDMSTLEKSKPLSENDYFRKMTWDEIRKYIGNFGEMNEYIEARAKRIFDNFLNAVRSITNKKEWHDRRKPTGIQNINALMNGDKAKVVDDSNVMKIKKIAEIREIILSRLGKNQDRCTDTKTFYALIINCIPDNIEDYEKKEVSLDKKCLIVNELKNSIDKIGLFKFGKVEKKALCC